MARKTKAVTSSRREYLESTLMTHERVARKAAANGVYGAATTALKAAEMIRTQLDALDASEGVDLSDLATLDVDDTTKAMVASIRRLRAAAKAEGSYKAASDLARQEQALIHDARAAGATSDDRPEMTPDQLVTAAIADLSALPPDLRQRILRGLKG